MATPYRRQLAPVLESTHRLSLPDAHIAVCGDWHGNLPWARAVAKALHAHAPEVTTVVQLGDWWMRPDDVDAAFAGTNVERVLVQMGNHEQWDLVTPLFDEHLGEAVRVSALTWILPRPFRMDMAGREVLSLGGAASVDRLWRRAGRNWWPDEAITDEHVAGAIAGGPADVFLTHETPEGTPVRAVQRILSSNPFGLPQVTLLESLQSRRKVTQVWDAVHPKLLMHGHMHAPGGGVHDDGRRVLSLGRDGQEGNVAIVDMTSLDVRHLSLSAIAGELGLG